MARWPFKPPLGVPINRAHPIAQQLQALVMPSAALVETELVSGNVGVILGTAPTLTATPYGTAISLSAANQAIQYSAPTVPNSFPLTISAIVRPKGTGGGDAFGKSASNTFSSGDYAVGGVRFDGSSNSVFGAIDANGTATYVYFGLITTLTGLTCHLVMTYDGQNVVGYLNGVQTGTAVKTAAVSGTTKKVAFGGNTNSASANADVDRGMIWSRVLTLAEIQQLYADPYCFMAPPSPLRRFKAASSAVAFLPAWARGSNRVIGSGTHV